MKRFAIFLNLTAFLLSGGCGAPPEERRSLETPFEADKQPVQESWNLDLALTDAGIKKASLRAAHAEEFQREGKSVYILEGGVAVAFYGNTGNSPTTITADRAVVHENQDIEAYGNVVATSGQTVLKTTYLKRTAEDRLIRSNSRVAISDPDGTVQGIGFESDEALKKYRIFKASGEALVK
ncbi:LPS export ABC transporter periplasmic protein LptC [Chlorobium limicola]